MIRQKNGEIGKLTQEKEILEAENRRLLRQKKQFKWVIFLTLAIIGCGIGAFYLYKKLGDADIINKHQERTIQVLNGTIKQKNDTISNLQDSVAILTKENEKVNNEYNSFKYSLGAMQPFLVTKTSFNSTTGQLSFNYYGLKDTTVTIQVRALSGKFVYQNSSSVRIYKGNNSSSIYLSDRPQRGRRYSLELLVDGKIVGGNR